MPSRQGTSHAGADQWGGGRSTARSRTPEDTGHVTPAAPRYPAGVDERYEAELAQSTRVLDDVDRALERLSEGTYGTCETCGAPILGADLAADPTRRVLRAAPGARSDLRARTQRPREQR